MLFFLNLELLDTTYIYFRLNIGSIYQDLFEQIAISWLDLIVWIDKIFMVFKTISNNFH